MSSAHPPPATVAPGTTLDRYELLCPIAEGGMASVWIARQTGKHGFEKLVAIKTILPELAAEPQFQRMFLDEARIASHIEHDNVARILDVGEEEGVTYLVMEYIDGDSLAKVHRELQKKGGQVPLGVLLRVMADVCGGLHAAHELRKDGGLLNVVHRDVSPQNILVNTKGVAKLIDFGIARARDRVAADTRAGQVKGKVRYMAPEQALGRAIDRRADIWAVGAVMYHLLSGRPPYDGKNDVETLMSLTSGRPPMPLSPDTPPAVTAIVRRALSAAHGHRFVTAAEMQGALERAMVQARVPTGTAAVESFFTSHMGESARQRHDAVAQGIRAATARRRITVPGHSPADAPPSGPGGTLGQAAVEIAPPATTRRRTLTIAAVAGAVAATALGVGSLDRKPAASRITGAPDATGASGAGSSAGSASRPTVPPAASAPSAWIPTDQGDAEARVITVVATDLPIATAPPAPASAPAAFPGRPPIRRPPQPPPAGARPRHDDGF